MPEQPWSADCLSAGLDYYKLTMSQLQYQRFPQAEVTFALINRSAVRLATYVDVASLQAQLDAVRAQGFTAAECAYMASLRRSDGRPVFAPTYLAMLATARLPAVQVRLGATDLQVETQGSWPLVTFWETVVMALINEAYFRGWLAAHPQRAAEVWQIGEARLADIVARVRTIPDLRIVDFGTRRRFGWAWHRHVITTLQAELPQQLIGTSNVALAAELGLRPIGTFAHEMPMVYAALAEKQGRNVRASHQDFLHDWYDLYGSDLSIALTDTFGSGFFFDTFTVEQARAWRGFRHDSGDPIAFGEQAIAWYQRHDIDPRSKSIVFSDSLTLDTIVQLHRHFAGRIGVLFGWGTRLTNDVGLTPLNIVMKAVAVDGIATVKLSDHVGKHTGPSDKIAEYQRLHFAYS
jgi:nicotinate phosphoribosyltransferase